MVIAVVVFPLAVWVSVSGFTGAPPSMAQQLFLASSVADFVQDAQFGRCLNICTP